MIEKFGMENLSVTAISDFSHVTSSDDIILFTPFLLLRLWDATPAKNYLVRVSVPVSPRELLDFSSFSNVECELISLSHRKIHR